MQMQIAHEADAKRALTWANEKYSALLPLQARYGCGPARNAQHTLDPARVASASAATGAPAPPTRVHQVPQPTG